MSNQALEIAKLSDKIMVKFGFDLDQLILAIKEFDLNNDKTIVSFSNMARAQKEQEQKAEFEKAQPKPEVLKELLARGKALGTPQYK